jgi:hypothetical protein
MSPVRFHSLLACVVSFLCLADASSTANIGCYSHPGDSIQSVVTPVGDTDPFVFDAARGATLSASLKRGKGSELVPDLRLLDPQGVEIDLAANLKLSAKRARLKNLLLPRSGRYMLVVLGADGTSGAYLLKTKTKPPKASKEKALVIAPGETRELSFCGVSNARVSILLKVKTKGGGLTVLELLDPDGKPVAGFEKDLRVSQKKVSGKITLLGRFGTYVIRLGGAPVTTTFDTRLKVKFPKLAKRRLTLGPDEPTVTSVYASATGSSVGIEGTEVTIEGSNFATEGPDVWFGRVRATGEMTVTANRIRVPAPPGQGVVTLTILNPDGNTGVAEGAFEYAAPPRITTLAPTSGPATGGTPVTITGVGLSHVDRVKIGSEILGSPPIVIDDSTVTFTTEPHTPGMHPVHLIDAFGQSSPVPTSFEFIPAPRIVWLDTYTYPSFDGNSADIDSYFAVEDASGPVTFSVTVPESGETKLHADDVVEGRVYLLRQHVYLGFSNALENPHVRFDCSGSPPGPSVEMDAICPVGQLFCYSPRVTLGSGTLLELKHRLEGDWFGVDEEPDGSRHTVSFAVDSRGRVGQHRRDGLSTGTTADVVKPGWPPSGWSNDVEYRYADITGIAGNIRLVDDADHFTFAAGNGVVGVFERDAAGLPTYSTGDLIGSWSGVGYLLDKNFRTAYSDGQELVVDSVLGITGTYESGGTFTVTVTGLDATFGVVSCTWKGEAGDGGRCLLFLSPDKSYQAVIVPDDSGSAPPFPESHGFGGLHRQ